MLLNDLFSYVLVDSLPGTVNAVVEIDFSHPVFSGHFPGNPVLPGVVQLHILEQILSESAGSDLTCSSAKDIKYLNLMVPGNASKFMIEGSCTQEGDSWLFNGKIFWGDTLFTKIRSTFHVR